MRPTQFCERAAGIALLASVALAPWMHGSQRPSAIFGLSLVLLIAGALWIASRLLAPPRSLRPGLSTALVLLILVQGWWMYANAKGVYEPSSRAVTPIPSAVSRLPGTIEKRVTGETILLVSGLLAAFLVSRDLSHAWHVVLAWTIAVSGSALVGVGVLERMGAITLFAPTMLPREGQPFASYNYHGNAGSFINIVIPFVLVLVVRQRRTWPLLAGSVAMLAICIAGVAINASRAAMAIMPVVLAVFFLLVPWRWANGTELVRARTAAPLVLGTLLLTVIVLAGAVAAGSRTGLQRWRGFSSQLSKGGTRPILWSICWDMCRDAGWFGYGPGTFKMAFPTSPHMRSELFGKYILTKHLPGRRVSMWSNAHQDYLQTIIEWGWTGSALWGLLFAGAAGSFVFSNCRKHPGVVTGPAPAPREEVGPKLISVAAAAALTGLCLHALVDFPLQVPSLQLLTACCLGILWGSYCPIWREDSRQHK